MKSRFLVELELRQSEVAFHVGALFLCATTATGEFMPADIFEKVGFELLSKFSAAAKIARKEEKIECIAKYQAFNHKQKHDAA